MQALLITLFRINLALVLFAAAYYLILRRLTFYSINRIFLIFGILFSSIYPFIDLTELFYQQKNMPVAMVEWIPALNQQVNSLAPAVTESAYWKWLTGIFIVGVLVMSVRFVRQFFSLYLLHRRSEKGLISNTPVRVVDERLSPFSFWKNIYINPALHRTGELEHIIAHENVHVKQLHTADIILAELSVVFYWFNPGVWLMKKAIKENLEFITDEKVLKTGTDKKSYQYSLLDVGHLKPATPLANSFNFSDLKKRIRMMNAKRSSKLTLGRYVFILPLLIFISLAFTIARKDIMKEEMPSETISIPSGSPVVLTVPEAGAGKEPAAPAVRPRIRINTESRTVSSNIMPEPAGIKGHGRAFTDTVMHDITAIPPHVQRVQGFPIQDTIRNLNRTTASISTDSVITVIGYPSRRLNGGPQPELPATDSTPGRQANAKTERVVIGYRYPKSNN